MTEMVRMDVAVLSRRLAQKEISARQVAEAYLAQLDEGADVYGAFLAVAKKQALAAADKVDRRRLAGEVLHPLAGVPLAVKDNICTEGVATTCASRMLAGFVPPYSATAWQKLQEAGMVLLGKTNMDEFGMGASGEHSAFGAIKNPLDTARVAGGSSGGSAAAVAGYLVPAALGSDTGGSIRQPAAFCGLVGMKPTYGAVSRYGLVAFASSMDQIGPMTRTVQDNALLFCAMAGHDEKDGTSIRHIWPNMQDTLQQGVQGLHMALPREWMGQDMAPDVREAVKQAAEQYEKLGAIVQEVSLPQLAQALPAYHTLSGAEASSNLARFDGVRYGWRAGEAKDIETLYSVTRGRGFGPEVKRRVLLGTLALSDGQREANWESAVRVRKAICRALDKLFESCDILLCPTAPTVAWLRGTTAPGKAHSQDICTAPASLAGLPALSLPCGAGQGGLPVGLQLVGRAFSENVLYRAAFALEQSKREVGADAGRL